MKVMTVPPRSDTNRYLSSLVEGLERHDIDVVTYTWCRLLPVLRPALREKPDVVHLHWLNNLTLGSTRSKTVLKSFRTLVELLIARALGIRIVWTVHNLVAHERKYPRWDLFWRVVIARWCCDHLIVHCDTADAAVREKYHLGSTTPVTVIPHGHYVNAYPIHQSRDEAREELGLDPTETVFVYFGQIRPYKQVPHLIESYKAVAQEETTLIIAGDPKTESLHQKIGRKVRGRDDILTRLEFVPDEEVARYFLAADIIVAPYREILTSGSAILAMSFARPVIVPRLGCLPELVTQGQNGLLYDPDDSRGLRRAMTRALDADLATMGERGHRTVTELDWDTIAERTKRVYQAQSNRSHGSESPGD